MQIQYITAILCAVFFEKSYIEYNIQIILLISSKEKNGLS